MTEMRKSVFDHPSNDEQHEDQDDELSDDAGEQRPPEGELPKDDADNGQYDDRRDQQPGTQAAICLKPGPEISFRRDPVFDAE